MALAQPMARLQDANVTSEGLVAAAAYVGTMEDEDAAEMAPHLGVPNFFT